MVSYLVCTRNLVAVLHILLMQHVDISTCWHICFIIESQNKIVFLLVFLSSVDTYPIQQCVRSTSHTTLVNKPTNSNMQNISYCLLLKLLKYLNYVWGAFGLLEILRTKVTTTIATNNCQIKCLHFFCPVGRKGTSSKQPQKPSRNLYQFI